MNSQIHQASRRTKRRDSGYALLMAMFLVMAMIISSQVVLRNMATDVRRRHEAEAIWRGNQMVRAIRAYYRKTGHYPQNLEDLQKGAPGVHFLRPEAYKDPLNREDGEWRFIYVNAGGQIIGSVKYATLQQMAILDLTGGTLPSGQPGSSSDSNSQSTSSTDSSAGATQLNPTLPPGMAQGQQPGGIGSPMQQSGSTGFSLGPSPFSSSPQAGATSPTQATGLLGASSQSLAALAQLKPTGPVDGPVLGAFLTGVASKIDRPSVRIYKGGKTYQQWEFIWNPLEEQARAMQSGLSPQGQQPGVGLPIASPFGGTSLGPTNPGSQPPQTPPQSSPQNPQDQPLIQQQ